MPSFCKHMSVYPYILSFSLSVTNAWLKNYLQKCVKAGSKHIQRPGEGEKAGDWWRDDLYYCASEKYKEEKERGWC